MWYVYIIECGNGRFYTGSTNDLNGRLKRHQAGTGSKYTRTVGFKKVWYSENLDTRLEALRREIEIKKLSKKNKLKLIEGFRALSLTEIE